MSTAPLVHRHRTAMVRHTLSQPMSLAVRHRLVREGTTVFDYGCGQGGDLRALSSAGVEARGWDPHFAPDEQIFEAEIVNLGFVLNVIENTAERQAALERAWSISRKALVVSVMLVGAVPLDGLRPFGDGFLTSRGTFQKYYQHAEIRAVVAQAVGAEPVALAPGIFVAFRAPEDEQEFLLERRRGRRASTSSYATGRSRKAVLARPELHERIEAALTATAEFALHRGRLPHAEEMPATVHDLLASERVSFARAVDTCVALTLDRDAFEQARRDSREDLLVHYALGALNRTKSAARPSPSMVRDIRTHFGSQQQLAEQALEYLHALAEPQHTVAAMRECAERGLGILDEDQRLIIDGGRIERLSGPLRCYTGCASYLAGDVEDGDLVRLDPLRKRLTIFRLADRKSPFPAITSSVAVDLRRQDVILRAEDRTLIRKSHVFGLPPRSKQRKLEAEMADRHGLGPDKVVVRSLMVLPPSASG
ncbi:DNA phosphorothioation-associated putative methyltransferase [Sphingomonas phyllosphaerae]|uniref:DNA phosphorothioation-associated putative methyltransferase n=1 Tax=Sphingomonas phyllosphaerae TaxID=257003 RepID=UPI002412EC0F|nr:DNA phosphorothioation-associated putative methyltransferase [Sphingomonas phyllosphaerae]